jgi:RNA polymerase sigma factor (sigma-70 family)
MDVRLERIKSFIPEKFFFEESFKFNSKKILEDVILSYKKTQADNIFNCSPLLTKDQEFHLFRKYNYLKYKLKKLASVNLERLKEKSICEIESIIEKIIETRNLIMKSNMRLMVRPVSRYYPKDCYDRDEFLSNGYMHMMRAIDFFDYNRGFKFSTYFTNVLKRNLRRDSGILDKYTSKLNLIGEIVSKKEQDLVETNHPYNKKFISEIFKLLKDRSDYKRDVEILKKYHGVDYPKEHTLAEIGNEFGISKERVRQIKESCLEYLRDHSIYDPLV